MYKHYKSRHNKIIKGKFSLKKKMIKDKSLLYKIIIISCLVIVLIIGFLFIANEFIKLNKKSLPTSGSNPELVELNSKETQEKLLTLVNQENPLSESYQVNISNFEGIQCDEIIIKNLSKMFSDAKKAGYNLKITSAYISKEEQDKLYNAKVEELLSQGYTQVKAQSEAKKVVPPGNKSENQTGLSIKIIDQNISLDFSKTQEYSWLYKNCVNYGFILRYPQNKETETDMVFDPTLYRYVGIGNAKNMRSKDMCLDEYTSYVNMHKSR